MRPYLLASTVLVIGSLVLAHFILPASNQRKLDFEVEFIHTEFHIAEQHLYREIAPGTIVYMWSVNAGREVGYRFVLEQWEGPADGEMDGEQGPVDGGGGNVACVQPPAPLVGSRGRAL